MGFFSKKEEGGFMDVIRCDEPEYLVWKWRPSGAENSTIKENAIRYGSSLRVKEGELAVFVYKQNDGSIHDFILGPHDQTIKTANFPILSSIVGLGFGGESPFQAEIYFINLSGNIQMKFGIPYFDVFDPRFLDFGVPIAARGTITFNITDYKEFIKLNRLINFDIDDLGNQIKDAVSKYVKSVITNIPMEKGIPVLQMERNILEINDLISNKISERIQNDFGVNLKGFDLATIEADKESVGYAELRKVTAEQSSKLTIAQTDVSIKNLEDSQAMNAANLEETLRIQREELQRSQKLQTETNFIGTHALNQQADVLKTAAQSLGEMGATGGGGLNPAGMMTGMALGGAMGGQMAGMMNQMGQNMNQQQNTPPPPPMVQFHVLVNGQSTGPFDQQILMNMCSSGQLTLQTYVWRQGMANWDIAENIAELKTIITNSIPPPPPTL
jgi:membrane protease subunit (stomatin/prohibitin family)